MTREELKNLERTATAILRRAEARYDAACAAYTSDWVGNMHSAISAINNVEYGKAAAAYDRAYTQLSKIEDMECDDEPFGYDGLRQDMADLAAYRART